PEEYPVEDAVPCPAKAGDALFFSYLTIHGSGLNASQEARTTLLIQMRDPEDPPAIRTHESRGQGMMLRGIDPTCGWGANSAFDQKPEPTAPMGAMGGGMGRM
ncbi:MAG: phytanoyl-CoA dioxygenase family protein, partial [Armatimonadetes bacterium]|nr:phytanoyl-CoA dioxygenase family protein [Armatimonadota bacterium]